MIFRATTFAILLSTPLISIALADNTQANRIAKANYQYCIQESLGNEAYCGCISDVYEENLADIVLTEKEESFMIQGLSGQLAFDTLGTEDLKLSESITQKLDNPAFEEGFANCFAFIEDQLTENDESTDDEALTDDQRRAIEELEAIEEMEDEEED